MNNKIYKIKINEILEKIVDVEARNFLEALDKIKKMYEENEIILDDSNYVKTKFIHVKDEDKRI
jgi:hypothetical protein